MKGYDVLYQNAIKVIDVKSICLLIPYYGDFPNYFRLWLNSAKQNEGIDFIFITENIKQENLPKNVKMVKESFEELKRRIQHKYDFKISLETPYKLCDFRPAYGDIFEEIVKDYDYWGYCDIDLIFGDIRHFISDELLNNYEKINLHGHLSIYKNSDKMKTLYKTINQSLMNYRLAFSKNVSCHFDEYPGISLICKYEDIKYIDIEDYADIDRFSHRFIKVFDHSTKKNDPKDIKQIFKWLNGKLINRRERDDKFEENEIMYVHLQKRNMDDEIDNINSFYVVPNKFISSSNEVKDCIEKYVTDKENGELKKFKKECLKRRFIKDYWKVKWVMRNRIKD